MPADRPTAQRWYEDGPDTDNRPRLLLEVFGIDEIQLDVMRAEESESIYLSDEQAVEVRNWLTAYLRWRHI